MSKNELYLDEGNQENESRLLSETQPPSSPKSPSKAPRAGECSLRQSRISPAQPSTGAHTAPSPTTRVCTLTHGKSKRRGAAQTAGFVGKAADLRDSMIFQNQRAGAAGSASSRKPQPGGSQSRLSAVSRGCHPDCWLFRCSF